MMNSVSKTLNSVVKLLIFVLNLNVYMVLQDIVNEGRAADMNNQFRNRKSTMLSGNPAKSCKGKVDGGGSGGIILRKRYIVISGGTGGQVTM